MTNNDEVVFIIEMADGIEMIKTCCVPVNIAELFLQQTQLQFQADRYQLYTSSSLFVDLRQHHHHSPVTTIFLAAISSLDRSHQPQH